MYQQNYQEYVTRVKDVVEKSQAGLDDDEEMKDDDEEMKDDM